MNERIKQLAEQAQQYVEYTTPQGLEWLPAFKEKFAELIVRECANIVEGFTIEQEVALDDYEEYEASDVLKEHFGVKE